MHIHHAKFVTSKIQTTFYEPKKHLILPLIVQTRVYVGRVSPIHRSAFAIRQIILIHMVQSSSGQKEILQKT